MPKYTIKKAVFLFRKLFLRVYTPTFIATNISDIRSSVMIFAVLSAFTAMVSLLFVDSLVRTKSASFWIAFFRISSLFICFTAYTCARNRFRFFERNIFSSTTIFVSSLILMYIPMMVYDEPNHAYYFYASALVIASSAVLLWVEPIRVFLMASIFLSIFIPLHLNFAKHDGFDEFIFYQDLLIVFFLLGVGLTANILINYWRFEEYRSKIKLRITVGKLLKINKKIHDLSRIDSMTDLFNRRHLLEQFDLYKKRAKRENLYIGLVILDLDHLKSINDKYGHKQGDLAIQAFGRTLRSRVRSTDIAARIGGDEFCILASPVDKMGLEILTENIREKIEILRIPLYSSPNESIQITVSIGATMFGVDFDPTFDELYHTIDTALYASKNAGRNRITILSAMDGSITS